MRRNFFSHLILAIGALTGLAAPASAQTFTWTGAALDGFWHTPANWSPMTVPNSTTADVVFGPSANGNSVLLATGMAFQVQSLNFASATNNYFVEAQLFFSGQMLTDLQTITVSDVVTTTQTINLPAFPTGSLFFTGSGPAALTIANNARQTAVGSPTLLIGPSTVFGTPGTGGITVTGTGTTTISGSFANSGPPSNQVVGGLTKSGPGTLILSGNGTNLSGGFTLAGGTLRLDYTANTASKLGVGGLTSSGGDLILVPNASTPVTQNVLNTALTAGHTEIIGLSGAGMNLDLGAITRSTGTTFNVAGNFLAPTSTGITNGLLGSGPAFATLGGLHWATKNMGLIAGLIGTANNYSTGVNTDITGSIFHPSGITTNSLRFFTSGLTLGLTGTNTIQSGGILLPANVATATITGGILASGQNELLAHVYGSDLTIGSGFSVSNGLTKTGPGTLTLAGSNIGLNGPVNVNRGHLRVTSSFGLGLLTEINFNDGRTGPELQTFTVQLPDNVNATTIAAIRLLAYSEPGATEATVFTTGNSQNSRVTLGGVIASAPGAVTPLRFTGRNDDVSGFNLTGANTFTGTVNNFEGTLGINSNASLGNPVNTLILDSQSATAGGLVFLNGGIDVTRPVNIPNMSRVVSNGTDVNTISGPITGGTLVKAGTGTLVLTNAGNAGARDVRAGTLQVAAGALGATGDVILSDGTTLAVTGTDSFGATRSIVIGSAPGIARASLDVAANQTFMVDGLIANNLASNGTLVKTGAGTLDLTRPDNTYTGGTVVGAGAIHAATDGSLGAAQAPVTINPLGTLRFVADTSTGRTFNLFNGSVDVPSGVTLTMNGATVGGGFLRGTGTNNLAGGTSLTGVTTFTNTNLNVTGPASIGNFAHNGNLTVASGQSLTMNYATSGSAGRITVNGTANVSEFVSNGLLQVPNGGLINNTLSNMVLGGGSTTFVGAVGNLGGKIDLGGQQLHVRGGLLVTNSGSFASGNGVRNGTTIADYGALVKGTGPYQSVITQNGGQYLPGNSPGTSQVGDFFINGGGNLIFQITDAGPSLTFPTAPGTAGNNPGWGLTQVFTSMNFTATPASPYTITMQTQLPPPAAPDTPGLMSSFDPNRAYQWLIFDLQPGAVFNGTFDPNAINFATAQFVNSTMGGAFSLTRNGGQIFLTFTPVPEPVGILGAAAVAVGGFGWWRRRRNAR